MFQIITDSCCDIPAEKLEELKVSFIPMIVELDGKEYLDDLGKTFDYHWFLDKLKENAQPTTSQINVGRYLEFFRPYVKAKMPVLYLSLSSGLSGSYNSAIQAVAILKDEYEDVAITVIDTKAASLGQGYLVAEASRLQKEGKTFSEVAEWIEEKKYALHSWVTVDDLKHLERGGRISKTAAAIGGLLNIKPIIIMDHEGKLQNIDKVRGRNKAVQKLVGETLTNLKKSNTNTVYLANSGDDELVQRILKIAKEKRPTIECIHYQLGPTIASHTGYGCLAIFSFGDKR